MNPVRSIGCDPVQVMLVHRRPTLRDALRLLLEGSGGIQVIAETGDPAELPMSLDASAVDVAVWDAGTLDAWATRLLRAGLPGRAPALLVLAESASDAELERLLRAGIDGCVLTTDEPQTLACAVCALARGHSWLSPPVARRVLDLYRPLARLVPPPDEPLTVLSQREREVLRLLALGRSNGEIAAVLILSSATVKTHVSRILGKLGVRDRVQASAVAHRAGLLQILH